MKLKDRYEAFLREFMTKEPEPVTLLKYRTPFELLVAVILSAQCTDRRINTITPTLFRAFPTPYDLAVAPVHEVLNYIRSVSYPNNKAKYLVAMARQLVEDFKGKVPKRRVDLEKLAGVGRKTAHVVLSTLYHKSVIAVDTHVFRVSKRLGLVSQQAKTPLAVEKQLMRHVPKAHRVQAHHWFIGHGRRICKAVKPTCEVCPFTTWCKFYRTKT